MGTDACSIPSFCFQAHRKLPVPAASSKYKKNEEKFGGKEILRIFASAIRETVDENNFRTPVDTGKIDILVR